VDTVRAHVKAFRIYIIADAAVNPQLVYLSMNLTSLGIITLTGAGAVVGAAMLMYGFKGGCRWVKELFTDFWGEK
jgi:uncharacterized membrane-anchored protein